MKQKSSSTAKLPNKHKSILTANSSAKRLQCYALDRPQSKPDQKDKDKHSQQQGSKNRSTAGIRQSIEHNKSKQNIKTKEQGKVRAITTIETLTDSHQQSKARFNEVKGYHPVIRDVKNPVALQGEFLKKIINQKRSNIQSKTQKNSRVSSRRNSIDQKRPKVRQVGTKSPENSLHKADKHPKKSNLKQKKSSKQQVKPVVLGSRYSLDVKPVGVQKQQIEKALKDTYKKMEGKPEKKTEKNFVDMFKAYKKSFDIGPIKTDKGDSQSSLLRNGSSFSIPQGYLHKTDKMASEQLAVDPTKNQDKIRRFKKTINIEPPIRPQSYQALEDDLVMIKQDEVREESDKQSIVKERIVVQFQEFKDEMPSQIESGSSNEKGLELQRGKVNNTSSTQQPCSQEDRQRMEKNFENSKYYVQPIPSLFVKETHKSLIDSESPIQPHPLDTIQRQLMRQVEVQQFEL